MQDRIPLKGKRVCFVTSYYDTLGGLAKSARRIVQFLAEEGYDVHVVTSNNQVIWDGKLCSDAIMPDYQDGVPVYKVPVGIPEHICEKDVSAVNSLWMDSFYRCIRYLDATYSFDLFHGFYFAMAYPCLRVAENGVRSVIASIRGDELEKWALQPGGLGYVLPILKHASWITTVGSDLLQVAMGLEDISGRCSFIANSIVSNPSMEKWKPTDVNEGVVGTVGRFAHFKDIPNLVKGYAHVDKTIRRRLLLVGDFPEDGEKKQVAELVRENKLDSEVGLTGYVSDFCQIKEHLKSMRVFVSSSKNEGMPNAVLEAAASGLPIVATQVGGINDILENRNNALLVPPSNSRALGEAIQAILRDRSLAVGLSKGALKVAQGLHPKIEKQSWLDLYDFLGDAKRRGVSGCRPDYG